MKMRNLFLLLTLLGVTASCTNEQDVKLTQGGRRGEIQIMFNGNGTQTEYTRAIATESENMIETLDIYIFASDKEAGPFYFVEKWKKGDADDETQKTFTLQGAGANRKASIFPTEFELYRYLKIYCVANAGNIYHIKDGTTALTFQPLEVGSDGKIDLAKATKDDDIKKGLLSPVQDEVPIVTPLPMAGMASTTITSDYSLITVEMIRRVARFDIVNDAATSNLTIEKITPLNARSTFPLYELTEAEIFVDKINPVLDKYPTIDFTALPNANKGTTQGAFYVHPTQIKDKMQLLIEGNYSGVPVSYYVKIANTPEPTLTVPVPDPVYINVKTNHRYTLRIKDVREAGINVLFDIEDWTSGGGMIIKPDNNILPVVEKVTNIPASAGAAVVTVVTNEATAHTDSILHIKGDGRFTIEAIANGITKATIKPLTPGVAGINWFLQSVTAADLPDNNVVMTPDGLKKTKLTFYTQNTTAAAYVGQKALLTLYNQSASKDSALERTYIVALPEIDVLPVKISTHPSYVANTYKNYIDNTDPANPIIYQYQVAANKTIYLDVDEYTLAQHTIKLPANTAALGITTAPTYTASTKILAITTLDPSLAAYKDKVATFQLIHAADPTKITNISIVRMPVLAIPSTAESSVKIDSIAENKYEVTVDVNALATAHTPDENGWVTFDIDIRSIYGMTSIGATNSWVKSIVKKTNFDAATGSMTFTVTIDTNSAVTTDLSPTIAMSYSATPLTLTFKKVTTPSAP